MARRKTPENESAAEKRDRQIKEAIANSPNRSEKTSWNRKMDNMVKMLATLRPIEEKIIELQAQKMPIFDEVQTLRNMMVNTCVHPYEYLAVHADHVECKFCGKRIRIPDGSNSEET